MTAKRKRAEHDGGASVGRGVFRGDGVAHGRSVLIVSDRRLAVSGCRGIAEYSDTIVRLSLRELELTVLGVGLNVKMYCGDEIEVCGRIDAVNFGDNIKKEHGR